MVFTYSCSSTSQIEKPRQPKRSKKQRQNKETRDNQKDTSLLLGGLVDSAAHAFGTVPELAARTGSPPSRFAFTYQSNSKTRIFNACFDWTTRLKLVEIQNPVTSWKRSFEELRTVCNWRQTDHSMHVFCRRIN